MEEDRNRKREWRAGRLIGQGAFAKVYLAEERDGKGCLACKIADTEEGRKLLEREAGILRRLCHPLFVRYVDFAREQERAMLWMEYAEGEDLSELLERQGPLPQGEAARIAAELAEGLCYLHELPEPLLYRDLKPDNIRVQRDDRIRLVDLGCVCTVEEAERSLAGSRGYAAPEQLERAVSGRAPGCYSDVYALGRLLHYMLTGQDPCQPPARKHPVRAYRPEVSPLLERLAEQCTCPEPDGRPPDMRSVLRQLAPFRKFGGGIGLWGRERLALLNRLRSGGRWEWDFWYEKCVVRKGEPGEVPRGE